MMIGVNGHTATAIRQVQVDGIQLAAMARAGTARLEAHVEEVNRLNVFPVPDGDTGTNMLWTMRAACERVAAGQPATAAESAAALARGALLGARGNSGVILSQFWQGVARGLAGDYALCPAGLARALEQAREAAHAAVAQPVAGTILTVIHAGAQAAYRARNADDLCAAWEVVVLEARAALARTPDLLPVLREAGVVDSGGQGLLYILEGMLHHLQQAEGAALYPLPRRAPRAARVTPAPKPVADAGEALPYPYDVQFLLSAPDLDVAAIRADIEAMGDSALVVADGETIKVHVHVANPGVPLQYAASLGWLQDVVVENMQAQVDARRPAPSPIRPAQLPARDPAPVEAALGVVAVAAGDGLSELFRQLGATVVDGGQSNNPGVETLLAAVEQTPAATVILLPNNKNVVMAAEAAAAFSAKEVIVLPVRTLPAGIAAMLAFNAGGEATAVAAAMREAGRRVVSGAITTAIRSVRLNGVAVGKGQALALIGNQICAAADSVEELLPALLGALAVERRELLTLYYGAEVTGREAQALAETIAARYPALEVEVLAGGTPHYHYLLGAE